MNLLNYIYNFLIRQGEFERGIENHSHDQKREKALASTDSFASCLPFHICFKLSFWFESSSIFRCRKIFTRETNVRISTEGPEILTNLLHFLKGESVRMKLESYG